MPSDAPDNLRKFLESDDPAMISMGLSMAKGSDDASRLTLGQILGFYMFHGDKEIRSLAKTAFTKLAPSVPKVIVRKYWQAEYRTQPWVWEGGWMQKMVSEIDEAGINPVYLLIRAFVAGDEGTRGVIIGILEKIEVVDDSAIVVAALVQMISEVKRWNRGPLTNEKAAITIIENIGGEQAVDALAGLLGNNLEINEVVADTLGTLGDVRAVEPLISVLSNDSEAVARTLGILGDARAVGPLIKILGEIFDRPRPPNHYYYVHRFSLLDKDISAFIVALIKLDDTHAVELLIKALDDKEDNDAVLRGFRRGAAEALGNIGDARAVEPLIKALGEDKSEVRWPAAGALGKIGDKRAVDPLIEELGDDDESVNSSAAEALGEIGDARAVEPLIKALGNESRNVC